MLLPIDADEFMSVVVPLLEKEDPRALAQTVSLRWRPRQLCSLLQHENVDVRKVAAVTLGFVGDRNVAGYLTRSLRDQDACVNQMAEHGLWSIWFRSGNSQAAMPFREGIALLGDEVYRDAIMKFQESIGLDPMFAEAHNQCAIAHFFLSEWTESIREAQQTVRLAPCHFGAIAGMGHCYTQLGDLQHALACYRRAIRINPRMPGVARAIDRLEGRANSSGESMVDQIYG